MTKLAGGVLTLLLVVTPAPAQILSRQFTNAHAPSRLALDPLNLKLAWRTYLPVSSIRDGIFSIQMLDSKQIVVQTVSGVIVSIDADTGVADWKASVGVPYRVGFQLGYNKKSIFAVRGDRIFSVDRVTGDVQWRFILPNALSAAPLADEEGVYLVLGANRIFAYILMTAEEWLKAKENRDQAKEYVRKQFGGLSTLTPEQLAHQLREAPLELDLAWEFLFNDGRILLTPLQTAETLTFATTNGIIATNNKFTLEERYRFKADAPVSAPLGQHGDLAYAASEDFNLYAVDIPRGKLLWRFTSGAPIKVKPAVLDRDVFIVADKRGLYRIDRETGEELWRNRDAHRFLSMNRKFVYALDRHGRLVVLDKNRGTQLGLLNTRDFVLPVTNELTDRVFLASHNGLLVCLRDQNQVTPLVNKHVVEKKGVGFRPQPKKEKKDEEKGEKKEEKKDKDE
jgi:outer membrane protein assembly factor BamB